MNRRPVTIDFDAHPPPAANAPLCAANTPVTWGELYLLLQGELPAVAASVLIKILEMDTQGRQMTQPATPCPE